MHSIPRPEHPRPDFCRPEWLNLNGEWQFAFDDEKKGVAEKWYLPGTSFDGRITVPFCYQSAMSGVNVQDKHEVMWYRRSFRVPEQMAGKQILLRFGAVDYECDVFVNGVKAGSHRGGYTPFAMNITDLILNGQNDLCVRVRDPYDSTQPRGKQNWKDKWVGCWYTPCSGIWQTVYLEAAGFPYLLSSHITPDIDAGNATLMLSLNEKPVRPVRVDVEVTIRGKLYRAQSALISERVQRVVIDMISADEIEGFEKWSPNHPALYDVNIRLEGGDEVNTYFGMRSVEIKDGYVLLNKSPLYQRLVLDQGYWPESLLTPPDDEAIQEDIRWTKKFGYNGARKHQKLEDPRYYYWADKMGLLVWGEVPSAYAFSEDTVNNLSETLSGFIDRDYNHPSIIAWVPLNESWGVDRIYRDKNMQNCANMLYYQAKALDGTRLVSSNDGWELAKTDIFGLHDYAPSGRILSEHFKSRELLEKISCDFRMGYALGQEPGGDEAFMLTEYGGIAFEDGSGEGTWGYHAKEKDEEAFFRRYASQQKAVWAIPFCRGYCYTQLTDVQQEINGLLTPDRRPKVDVERFAALTVDPVGGVLLDSATFAEMSANPDRDDL
ncbi:MAG: glycoside hydrolase family 2 TIM barrel-domain containing protein [Christensenellales bacterium]|nr:glycoside hydrolase family 2 TIM barrel-domain containing protein [Christensenellales bacterium]